MNNETKKQEAIRFAWEELIGLDNYQKIKERINFDGYSECKEILHTIKTANKQ